MEVWINQSRFLKITSGLVKRVKATSINHGYLILYFSHRKVLYIKKAKAIWPVPEMPENPGLHDSLSSLAWNTQELLLWSCVHILYSTSSSSWLTLLPRRKRRHPAKGRVPVLTALTLFTLLLLSPECEFLVSREIILLIFLSLEPVTWT